MGWVIMVDARMRKRGSGVSIRAEQRSGLENTIVVSDANAGKAGSVP